MVAGHRASRRDPADRRAKLVRAIAGVQIVRSGGVACSGSRPARPRFGPPRSGAAPP